MMLLLMSGCCSWTADAEWLLTLPFPYCAVLLPPEITEICRLYTRYGISLVVPQVNVTREYPTPLSQFEWPWVWGSLAPGCLYIYMKDVVCVLRIERGTIRQPEQRLYISQKKNILYC